MSSTHRQVRLLRVLTLLSCVAAVDLLPVTMAIGQVRPPVRDRERDRGRDVSPEEEPAARDDDNLRIRPTPGRGRWTLGITATDTETGVRINRVMPRSAADRAGLERGDLIVTVNGYQVGFVQGRLYDLPTELERRADRRGRVRLLVQNRRDGQLQNLDVRLDSGSGAGRPPDSDSEPSQPPVEGATLTGRALLNPPNVPLPFRATLTVQMYVLGGRGQPGQLIGQNVVQPLETSPIPFSLRYDASRIPPGGQVGLAAQIAVNGRVLFETPGVQRIGRPGEGPADVLLEVAR